MGKVRIKNIEEETLEEERSQSQSKNVVQSSTQVNQEIENEDGARQTLSESTGRTSDFLRPDKPKPDKSSSNSNKPKIGKKLVKVRSKKYQEAVEKIEKSKKYELNEAVKLAKDVSITKFDGSLEAHLNTKVKNLRGLVNLPFAKGKKLTILAFGAGAEKSGADLIGTDATLEEIIKGKINFDVLITTPDWMPKLARAAKVLGPRGLMPNPKNGTISDNLEKIVTELQGGKTEYKTESNGQVIHLSVGKVNQPDEELIANIKTLYQTIGKSRISALTISPTMGPGIKVDLNTI